MIDASGEGPAKTELNRLEAEKIYLDVRAREALTKLRHTLAKPLQNFEPGMLVMFFRKLLGSKKASLEGRWRGPGRVALIEPPVHFRADEPRDHGRSGIVVWVIHGSTMLRCHPIQLRRPSERETLVGFQDGGTPRHMPSNMSDVMKLLKRRPIRRHHARATAGC